MQTSLYASLLIGLSLAALWASQIPRAAAQSATPTYVLGVSSPLDPLVVDLQSQTSSLTILSGVSGLSLLGPGSILFVDGTWLQSASSLDPTVLSVITTTALNGVPTIVVRGNPAFLQNSIAGLLQIGTPNLPLIASGIKILSTLPSGTKQAVTLQVIQGFDYAVNTEFGWAQQQLATATTLTASPILIANTKSSKPSTTSFLSATTTGPFWQFLIQATTNTGDFFAPMARVTSTFTVFQLQNSGSSNFKWFNFFINQTLQPGISLSNSNSLYANSNWRNLQEDDVANVNFNKNLIVSSGPASTATSGPTMVTYSIGVNTANNFGAAVNSTQTQSYMLKNTNVTATSGLFQQEWVHAINTRTSSGALAFQIIPGLTDRVPVNQGIDLHSTFTSTFATLSGGTITQTASTGVQFAVSGG